MKKSFSTLVTIVFLFTQVGCATAPKRVLTTPGHNATETLGSFDPKVTFQISLRNRGGTFRRKGSELAWDNGSLAVRDKKGNILARYPKESIEVIEGSAGSTGLNLLKGLGYGAAGGLGLGLAVGLPIYFTAGSCKNADDVGDCEGLRSLAIALPVTGGLIVGSLLGLVVGAVIPKKAKIRIVPTVSQNGNDTRAGLGVSLPF